MMHRSDAAESVAAQNWTRALETYHAAVDAYRRVATLRIERAVRRPVTMDMPAGSAQTSPPQARRSRGNRPGELTARECEIADLIALGHSNKQIARALVLTPGTVANHVAHILGKLGVMNRTQIAARVLERGRSGALLHLNVATDPDPEQRQFAV